MRLGDDQVADPRVQRSGQRRVQQRPRVSLLQPSDFQLGQPGHFPACHAGREYQGDRVGAQPPRREPQRLRRGVVQPLLVVDQADQRAFSGYLGQQAQYSQPHQEPVWRRTRREAERGLQRITLRDRNIAEVIQHRRAQLVQPGERKFHLRLHAHRACHPAAPRLPGQVLQ